MVQINKIRGDIVDLVLTKYCDAIPEKMWLPAYKFNIVLHETDIVVGHCDARIGFNENIYYGGNLGYTVNEEYRGNGYAGMAVELLKQVFIANDINKVYITNNQKNLASIRVCEKIGAKFLGVFELPLHNNQRVVDGDVYKNIWELIF